MLNAKLFPPLQLKFDAFRGNSLPFTNGNWVHFIENAAIQIKFPAVLFFPLPLAFVLDRWCAGAQVDVSASDRRSVYYFRYGCCFQLFNSIFAGVRLLRLWYKLRLHPVLLKCNAMMAVTTSIQTLNQLSTHSLAPSLVCLSCSLSAYRESEKAFTQILTSVYATRLTDTTTKFYVIYLIDIRPDTFSFAQSISYLLSLRCL